MMPTKTMRGTVFTTAVMYSIIGTASAAAAPTAITEYGVVTGKLSEGMKEFLGLRYAAPPIAELRWQPPQPAPLSTATRTATSFGPHCSQLQSPFGIASTNEDCLFLNVFAPGRQRAAGARPLPVMIYIHGGAFLDGESDDYDPIKLVNDGDVIVVTLNYRLGYFGFLATTGLDAEGHVAANYGLQDQQFAFDWVKRNIAGFGGDPQRVTIFGESAGGLSVLSHMASPTAYGLFGAAIVESGSYGLAPPNVPSLSQAEAAGAAVATGIGCAATDTACLRAASVQQVLAQQASPVLALSPIVDGTTLPLSVIAAFKTAHFNKVPMINGSNHDEYRLFLTAANLNEAGLTAAEYPVLLGEIYGAALASGIEAKYPVTAYAQPVLALAAVLTDQNFACNARQIDRWASLYVPVYAYEFSDRHAPEIYLPPSGYPFGAAHASELQFLFQNLPELPGTPALTQAEEGLSNNMVRYWTNFAHGYYSPDGAGTPSWAPYARGADVFQSLAPPTPAPESDFSSVHHCGFWEPIVNPS